ncbi:hypothetical protein [Chondromyces apiculatus]|uniref:Uncharacterized protein n=1 Tax=Chondromyces apiculatus DSM 436 TaxID=1192034 RepID=A0A017TAA2_9BACT|nr:hypothetical protein [Chondromyces apiculatus]EYF06208.1 Hypothetical protein CAP_2086 [Chondromyces apiculatus DSM 436]
MENDEQLWRHMGQFEVRVDPPDLYLSRLLGNLGEQDVELFYETMLAAQREHGRLLWIADCSRLGDIEPAARRLVGKRDFGQLFRVVIIHGANFKQRVLATMLFHAARLLTRDKNKKDFELHFVEDEAAGLRLVDVLREDEMPPRISEVRPILRASPRSQRRGTRAVS